MRKKNENQSHSLNQRLTGSLNFLSLTFKPSQTLLAGDYNLCVCNIFSSYISCLLQRFPLNRSHARAQLGHSCFDMAQILLLNLQTITQISVSTVFNDTRLTAQTTEPAVCFLQGTSRSSCFAVHEFIHSMHYRSCLRCKVRTGQHKFDIFVPSKGAAEKHFFPSIHILLTEISQAANLQIFY